MASNKGGNMAHIADLMVGPPSSIGLNNYIARALSPQRSMDSISDSPSGEDKGKEKFIWRMHQPSETRKYQLFPAKDKLSITPGRNSPDPEQAFALAMSQSNHPSDRPIGAALRLKAKEVSLLRRRKPSVSDLGPMTTVQEVAMDSPTIPGRPPLHERSASAPGGNTWRRNVSGDNIVTGIPGPALDESLETTPVVTQAEGAVVVRRRSGSPKGPLSPKILAPLVIPLSTGPAPQRVVIKEQTLQRDHSASDPPPNVPPKSARMLEDKLSPQSRTPFTPLSCSTYTPLSSTTTNLSIPSTATPISATEGRVSPFAASSNRGPSPMGHLRGQSDSAGERSGSRIGHRREQSEASIMDRGRPQKRTNDSPIKLKRSLSKRNLQVEQKAFETLPDGFKAAEVPSKVDQMELDALKRQAIGQAAKFEVLGMKDVERLSRELRALDERCEYLRKTHHSLRAGRRNLHGRICTYLRSPRTAQFSHTSILKQEEALIALDLSIDDWVSKLEHAENRRMRVRQKLLEHVAAALTLPSATVGTNNGNNVTGQPVDGNDQIMMTTMALNRHISMGEDTPPRSPTKESTRVPSPSGSPARLALLIQADTQSMLQDEDSYRRSKESIRIYADSDVYALLADVEEEINRMSVVAEENSQELLSAVAFSGPVPSRTASPVVRQS